ncbi:hypothetical protein VTK26DRAFT_1862 [Humicola hyalothermophila]
MALITTLTLFFCVILPIISVFRLWLIGPQRNRRSISNNTKPKKVPVSVNYHFSRNCNYTCGFCFHTDTSSHVATPAEAKRALRLLADAGMRKINFAGGEPFLYPKLLGELIHHCKHGLGLESVSIVTNGSKVTAGFLRRYRDEIDILAVSCDSFDEETNVAIGRGRGDQVRKLYEIAGWCRELGIAFKINTVVNRLNFGEDMNAHISALRPFRWKCFQVLIVPGENDSEETIRDANKFSISDEAFEAFCERHKKQKCLVPESNRLMASSYLILDEYLRFLDKTGKQPSKSILEVGVDAALDSVFWDEAAFLERGGLYDWVKPESDKTACGTTAENLDW